jgi:antitoxin component HigA of HigAB toxin-antitoxin module
MNTGMQVKSTLLNTAINHWHYLEPYAKVPTTKVEYQKQRELLDGLMELALHKKDNHLTNLLQRKLTSDQIAQLAKRFHISPAVFYTQS